MQLVLRIIFLHLELEFLALLEHLKVLDCRLDDVVQLITKHLTSEAVQLVLEPSWNGYFCMYLLAISYSNDEGKLLRVHHWLMAVSSVCTFAIGEEATRVKES